MTFPKFSIISYIDTDYITKHLVKLSKNYDPNGLKQNFAVIYAKHSNFEDFWTRYKAFVSTVNYPHKLIGNEIHDISSNYPQYSNIRIGLTIHDNEKIDIQIFHIFINTYFE